MSCRLNLPLGLDNGRGWNIATDDFSCTDILEKAQLVGEADYDSKDQEHDKEFKDTEASHGAFWLVEKQNNENIQDGNGAACNQWDLEKQVQCNGSTNNLAESNHTLAPFLIARGKK